MHHIITGLTQKGRLTEEGAQRTGSASPRVIEMQPRSPKPGRPFMLQEVFSSNSPASLVDRPLRMPPARVHTAAGGARSRSRTLKMRGKVGAPSVQGRTWWQSLFPFRPQALESNRREKGPSTMPNEEMSVVPGRGARLPVSKSGQEPKVALHEGSPPVTSAGCGGRQCRPETKYPARTGLALFPTPSRDMHSAGTTASQSPPSHSPPEENPPHLTRIPHSLRASPSSSAASTLSTLSMASLAAWSTTTGPPPPT